MNNNAVVSINKDLNNDIKICSDCNTFYGSKEFDYLCSVCFKKSDKKQIVKTIDDIELETNDNKKITIDESKCNKCNKKLNMFSYKCRCEYYFCSKHRLAEYHDCNYDYAKDAKKQLEINNPVIKHDKVEKI